MYLCRRTSHVRSELLAIARVEQEIQCTGDLRIKDFLSHIDQRIIRHLTIVHIACYVLGFKLFPSMPCALLCKFGSFHKISFLLI